MSDKRKDILSHLSTEVDQETLLRYLNGQLSEKEKQAVEEKMLESEFTEDAMEGLESFEHPQHLELLVDQLNRDLKKKTGIHKKRREKMRFRDQPGLYISALILLLLIALCVVVILRMKQHG